MNISLPTSTSRLPSLITTLSPEQSLIPLHLSTSRQHTLISACAGSGKTFTLIAALAQINHSYPSASIAVLAFGNKISAELDQRIRSHGILHTTVGTSHRFGKLSCESHLRRYFKPNSFKLSDLAKILFPSLPYRITRIITHLASIAKSAGVGITLPLTEESILSLFHHHDIDLPESKLSISEFISLTHRLLVASAEDEKKLDVDDLIWMPLLKGWEIKQYDFVLIDECQDINATRLELVGRMVKKDGTITAVGDEPQAIFGFTGADDKSMQRIKERFQPKEFSLTYSRRCSKAVIRHAQKIVPSIKALPDAKEGSVTEIDEPTFMMKLRMEDHSKDAVLCRKNAPLMSIAVQLLNQGVPVRFEGTDQMKQLQSIIKRMEANDIPDLLVKMNQHQRLQALKLSPYAYEKLEDQLNCIRYFAEGFNITKLTELEACMKSLFSDSDEDKSQKLTLCSVHKSKGLEWKNVYLLGRNAWMPSRMATLPWMLQQEQNLIYVAITRAIENLIEVTVKEK